MSNLLNAASLVVTPNSYKEGKLYSVIPNTGAGDMSVVRATTATRVNSSGLVEIVPYNLLSYSNAFNTAPWYMNVTSGQAGKDGQNNAWLLTKVGSSTSDFYNSNVYDGDQTFTIYVKKESGKGFKLYPIGTTSEYSEVNLQTGAVYFSTAGITSTTVEAYSSTWWKISVALNMINSNYYIYVTDGAGTQIASSITIQDAQVNIGLTAKPYFPTTDRLNIPRLDYSNGTCPSLLVEPQRTNIALYSSSFDNAWWVKTASSITANYANSPDGTQNADRFVGNGTSGQHILRNTFIAVSASTNYTYSFYIKTDGISKIGFFEAAQTAQQGAFNLETKSVIYTSSNSSVKIEDSIDGFLRVSITTLTGSNGVLGLELFLLDSSYISQNPSTYSSNVSNSEGVIIYGAQLEEGSYATSYIPTTSASVTRNADVISKTGISSLIGQTEGTVFLDFDLLPNNPNASYLFTINDGTSANVIRTEIYVDGSISQFRTGIITSGVGQGDMFTTISQLNNKMAISYKLNEVKIFLNGVLVATDTSSTIPATNSVYLGNTYSANVIGSYFKSFSLWPTALTNDQLEALTGLGFDTYAEMASYYNYITQ